MKHIPPFPGDQLQAIARVLADTESGLTGSEIEHLLTECRVADVTPTMTKWKRLYNAFVKHQNKQQNGRHVVGFIHKAMKPVKFTDRPAVFRERRDRLNSVLSFSGMTLGEDGGLRWCEKADDIETALQRANRLHATLVSRQVHTDVLEFCKATLLQENYFHAVLEAMKSIAAKIRDMSGCTSDGAQLVDDACALGRDGSPVLAINSLVTDTDKGEQKGFANLLTGLFGTIRNPTAHAPKIEWEVTEQDAMDILTTLSLIHRKLDRTYRYEP